MSEQFEIDGVRRIEAVDLLDVSLHLGVECPAREARHDLLPPRQRFNNPVVMMTCPTTTHQAIIT